MPTITRISMQITTDDGVRHVITFRKPQILLAEGSKLTDTNPKNPGILTLLYQGFRLRHLPPTGGPTESAEEDQLWLLNQRP